MRVRVEIEERSCALFLSYVLASFRLLHFVALLFRLWCGYEVDEQATWCYS